MINIPRSHRWARRIAIVSTSVMVILLAAWVRSDPRTNLVTDWTAFDNTAERFFAGEPLYQPWHAETEPLPYLYPPFVILLALPLGFLGFYASWAVSVAMFVATFVVGLLLLVRSAPNAVDPTTGIIVATASGTVVSGGLVGQYSGVYVLAFGLAAWLWTNDRQALAGLALAILVMKPNLAIAVPVVLVWSRSWPALRGFVGGGAAAVVLSLPFGLDRWSEFVSNVADMAEHQRAGQLVDAKMVTIVGAARSAFDLGSTTSAASIGIWLISSLIVGLATLTVWQRAALAESPLRALGVLAAFMAIANPRLYFYDATLIIFGMLAVWLTIDVVGGELSRRWIPPICAALWFFSWGGVFPPLNTFVGPLAGVVLVVVALDARGGQRPVDGVSTEAPHEAVNEPLLGV